MSKEDLDLAERLLRIIEKDAFHTSLLNEELWYRDEEMIESVQWRRAMNFLEVMKLVEINDQGSLKDTTEMSDRDFGSVGLTELGQEAAELGLHKYLEQRREREEMRHRANRATARGYRINLWGIIFLVFGLAMSGLNLYVFYRQVFDPPQKAMPAHVVDDTQKSGDDSKSIESKGDGPKDTLTSRPTLGRGK